LLQAQEPLARVPKAFSRFETDRIRHLPEQAFSRLYHVPDFNRR
jgi:hypothetical protein